MLQMSSSIRSNQEFKPVIAEKIDLDHVEDAYSMMKEKRNLGRVLIDLKQ